jgi:protein SCO1/2
VTRFENGGSWRLAVLALSLALVGCTGSGGNQSDRAEGKEYNVRGKVTAINAVKPAVTLDHEDIPGLMKAMQMEFRLENPKLLDGIKVSDEVQGRLKRTDSGYVLTHLEPRTGG